MLVVCFSQARRFRLETRGHHRACVRAGPCLGRIGCFLNGCCYGQVACVDCPVYSVHFPLSAPARYSLVGDGSQTSAGFTFASEPQAATGVRVGQVEPGSAAARAGLKAGDVIEEVDGQRWFTFTEGSLLHLEGRGIPEAVLDKLKRLLPPPPQDPKELAAEPTDFTRQQFEDAIATVLDKNDASVTRLPSCTTPTTS